MYTTKKNEGVRVVPRRRWFDLHPVFAKPAKFHLEKSHRGKQRQSRCTNNIVQVTIFPDSRLYFVFE